MNFAYCLQSLVFPAGRASSYELRLLFTYSNCYWEVYIRFRGIFYGGGEGYMGETIHGKTYYWERAFPRRGR